MRLGVCLSVCLSVSQSARYLKNVLTDLNQILWNDRLSVKDHFCFDPDPGLDTDHFFSFIQHTNRMSLDIK